VAAPHQGAPGQMTSLEDPPPSLRPAYCFDSVTENKNVTIYDRFICLILTVKQSATLAACGLRATTKKVVNFFSGKKCIR